MRYINPKTDFAFKKIFGSEESKEILISFLNGIIYEKEDVIDDLEIIDPYQAPQIKGRKYTYLDVKANLKDGTKVIIEMQLLNTEAFEKRILFNTAKAYSMQLAKGEYYYEINPIISITINDFIMFEEFEDYRSSFVLKEENLLVDYKSKEFKLIFVELPKFKKSLEELENLGEKWIYFLKVASQIENIPDNLKGIYAIDKAFEIAERTNLTELELEELFKQEMSIQDQKGSITLAHKEGLEKGLEKGLQEKKKAQITLIKRFLQHNLGEIPLSIQEQLEKLSLEKLDNLGEIIFNFNDWQELQNWL